IDSHLSVYLALLTVRRQHPGSGGADAWALTSWHRPINLPSRLILSSLLQTARNRQSSSGNFPVFCVCKAVFARCQPDVSRILRSRAGGNGVCPKPDVTLHTFQGTRGEKKT